jgi:hypothetical protein
MGDKRSDGTRKRERKRGGAFVNYYYFLYNNNKAFVDLGQKFRTGVGPSFSFSRVWTVGLRPMQRKGERKSSSQDAADFKKWSENNKMLVMC